MAYIYRIVQLKTGRCYIGHTSKDPRGRWSQHRTQLIAGKHHSRFMQNAWNKYGQGRFKFEVIEECTEEDKLKREQYWIDGLNSCFNNAKIAGSRLGVKYTKVQRELLSKLRMGHATSEETKRKIALAQKGKKCDPHTDEAKKKISRSSKKWWKTHDQTSAQRAAMLSSLKLAREKSRVNKPGMNWRLLPEHKQCE